MQRGAVKTERAFNQPKKHSVLSCVTVPLPLASSLLGAEACTHTRTHDACYAGTREQRCQRPHEHQQFFFCTIPTYLQYIFRVVLALVAVVADLAICCFCFTTYADNCHAVCSALWISRAQVKQTIKINRKKECKKKRREFLFLYGRNCEQFYDYYYCDCAPRCPHSASITQFFLSGSRPERQTIKNHNNENGFSL